MHLPMTLVAMTDAIEANGLMQRSELQNLVKTVLMEATGDTILPYHLPIAVMKDRQGETTAPEETAEFVWPERLHAMAQKEAVAELEAAAASATELAR